MSGYDEGRRVEWQVMHDLTQAGYDVIRASSSKGCCDVIGFKTGQVAFVNAKRTTMPGPAERLALLRLAAQLPFGAGLPLVALHPRRQPLQYRQLTGPGPKDWAPWTPDEVTA